MKKTLSFLLVLAIVFGACSLTACDLLESIKELIGGTVHVPPSPHPKSEGLEFELNDDGESYSLIGIGDCTDVEIYIPNEHEGKPVTTISNSAFEENENIIGVDVPHGILKIGESAFANCTSLKWVYLPEGLLEIGYGAFMYCYSLESIIIPTTVTEIPDQAFQACLSLRSIELHNGITNIGEGAFTFCISLESLKIPQSIGFADFKTFYMFLNSLKSYEIYDNGDFLYTVDGNLYADHTVGCIHLGNYLLSYAMGKNESSFTVPSNVTQIPPAPFPSSLGTKRI